ncbi:unnamed protein product [Polarella glacialis]|uniref:Uncharacterized protein n=1 Tax=Polarella glacialis TaxID=89957 RepID=A0A813LZ31_POLGL|nr:unnamed protein product [Polarella glacialis]
MRRRWALHLEEDKGDEDASPRASNNNNNKNNTTNNNSLCAPECAASPLAESLKGDPLAADFLVTAFAAAAYAADCGHSDPSSLEVHGAAEARSVLAACPALPSVLRWYFQHCESPHAAAQTGVMASLRTGEGCGDAARPLLRALLCRPNFEVTTAARYLMPWQRAIWTRCSWP